MEMYLALTSLAINFILIGYIIYRDNKFSKTADKLLHNGKAFNYYAEGMTDRLNKAIDDYESLYKDVDDYESLYKDVDVAGTDNRNVEEFLIGLFKNGHPEQDDIISQIKDLTMDDLFDFLDMQTIEEAKIYKEVFEKENNQEKAKMIEAYIKEREKK